MGRPTRLTPEVQNRVVAATTAGNYLTVAGEFAGLGQRTVDKWMTRGRAGVARLDTPGERPRANEAKFVVFYEAVTQARAQAEVRNVHELAQAARGGAVLEERTTTHPDGRVETITRYAPPDWRAAAWWLAHSAAGARWRRHDRVEVSGPEGGPVEMTVSPRQLLTDALEAGAARLAILAPAIHNGTKPPTVDSPDS